MRQYTVRAGDSPASIAARDDMAGCPKCAVDLISANPHKSVVTHPNGYRSFKSLREGETINLPDKWFDGTLDARPQAYFAALPYVDGITSSTLGDAAAGVLGDYAALDAATAMFLSLASLDDRAFAEMTSRTSDLVDAAIREAVGTSDGQAAFAAAEWARRRAIEMAAATEAGDAGASEARPEIQNVLSTAIASARSALQTFYSAPAVPTIDPIISVAQAAATAIASDPNYCASVARVGSSVNSAVHAFKSAWNASGRAAVPINTGNYEEPTANALANLLGSAPGACAIRVTPSPSQPSPSQTQVVTPPSRKEGLSTGEMVSVAALGAGVVGGVIYFATRRRRRRK